MYRFLLRSQEAYLIMSKVPMNEVSQIPLHSFIPEFFGSPKPTGDIRPAMDLSMLNTTMETYHNCDIN